MSSMPPPPFAPPVFDRRTLKAQRRAAGEQARLQRAQLRMQMRAARRRSVLGPLLLVALGTVLLLLQTGRLRWNDTLVWLGRWWPAVLIAAGLIMVCEWFLDRRNVSPAGIPLAPRRFLGSGTVALLILLAIVGATVMTAENGSAWARRNLDLKDGLLQNGFGDWRQVFGIRSEVTEEMHAPLSGTGALTVDDPRGDVTVTGSSQDGQVHVTVHRHTFTWQQSDLDERHRQEEVRFSGDRAHLVLSAPSVDEDDADLNIELPHDASLNVRSDHGDVSIGELRGALEVNARDGDVKLTALSGPVHLQTQDDNGDVTAHSLGAGLSLEGRAGDISVTDIEGPVSLHGDFFGTTHLEHIRGTVHFQSSFTEFACANLAGELNVEGRSDLDVHLVEGPVTLTTTNRNLTLDGVSGGITVADRNGSVNLMLAGDAAPVHVSNENGSVEVAVPPDRGFAVEARTQNGDIQDDFGLLPRKSGQAAELSGKLGSGGPPLTLQTTEGDVKLRKAGSGDDVTWDDAPQRITPVPSGTHKDHRSEQTSP